MGTPSKGELAKMLSGLRGFATPKERLEQYPTDGDTAALLLHHAQSHGDLPGSVADLGCGTGILGIGALLLGASHILFVDIDDAALAIARDNLARAGLREEKATFLKTDLLAIKQQPAVHESPMTSLKADCAIMNPPFGSRHKGADIAFAQLGLRVAPVIWSIHPGQTRAMLEAKSARWGARLTHCISHSMHIPSMYDHHRRASKPVAVIIA
ncbi:DNA methylase, partial [Candidatus Woesearchaeota archaeon CG11_big_fil_rev_8_21_14_0_20_57_5]